MMKWIASLMVLFLFSCTGKSEKSQPSAILPPASTSGKADSAAMGNAVQKQEVYPGSDTLVKELSLHDKNDHAEATFTIVKGDSLLASLSSSDRKANIRITQIEFPDSSFDGPFGKELKYAIRQHGIYKIIMGPNMMAGDPWSGDFKLKIWVK